ncbi:Similar to 6-hydroxy-D-nicotine oxidase; acc. no. P08159 [Pyronema omphalodes CBS 100304]|uniref:Similar to 6-hydroxy-D-nicotine oxidase acc. no. P08159 n=1 Tax=Pyronema omphalodes (strain CBS 100304) TaxID=1076935 RepID=U4LVP2_PYROM|nr:Similar to 6-hydroxy-D-nicotine oxidase; acc. no. P08159 [Pyronema omphalodes CBS 100304]
MHPSLLFSPVGILSLSFVSFASFVSANSHSTASSLASILSGNSPIITPNNPEWNTLTSRWDPYAEPSLQISVEATTISDIQTTVKFAVQRGIPLLITSTSHGFTESVRGIKNGIQISLRNFKNISVDKEHNTVTYGGGVVVAEIITELFKYGKRTSTGNCDCVGLGAGLGGGHGKLQGLHGLHSDNIISAQLVTASGELIIVSAEEHSDLFWGLRGAGHNFGVVVEVTMRIYDAKDADTWTNANYVFPGNKARRIFGFLNGYKSKQPKELTGFVRFAPTVSGVSDVVLSVQYGGHEPYEKIGAPFLALGPKSVMNQTVPFPQVATAMGIGLNNGFCVKSGTRRGHFSTQIKKFNIPEMEGIKAFYDETLKTYPQFNASSMVWEMYPQQAFKAVPADESAYPHRDLDMLSLFMVNYKDPKDDELARKLGKEGLKHLLKTAEGYRVYVNYGLGDEPNNVMYGGGWRLERLRDLKRRYDPRNVFKGYNPIHLG